MSTRKARGKIEVIQGKYAYKKKVMSNTGNPNILCHRQGELIDSTIDWLISGMYTYTSIELVNLEEVVEHLKTFYGKTSTKPKKYIILTYTTCSQAK